MNIEPPLRDGRTRNTGRRFETRLVTLSGDSYDDLNKIQHEAESWDTGGAPETNRMPDNEGAADLQLNENYEEEHSDTGSENNMIIDNAGVDLEEILYSDPEEIRYSDPEEMRYSDPEWQEIIYSDSDMSGSYEI